MHERIFHELGHGLMNHQSDIIQNSGARRSLSSENPDSAGDVEESEDDEIEFKEPTPVKDQTSLRRTSRRTSSSSSSFTPIKMVESPGEVTPKKTRKSPSLKKKEKTDPPKRSRGRPRKKKSSSLPEEESSVKCDDESANYGELTIEVAEKREEIEDSEEDEVTFIDEIFAESSKLEEKKKKRKQSYDWSENEVFSLIGMNVLY